MRRDARWRSFSQQTVKYKRCRQWTFEKGTGDWKCVEKLLTVDIHLHSTLTSVTSASAPRFEVHINYCILPVTFLFTRSPYGPFPLSNDRAETTPWPLASHPFTGIGLTVSRLPQDSFSAASEHLERLIESLQQAISLQNLFWRRPCPSYIISGAF